MPFVPFRWLRLLRAPGSAAVLALLALAASPLALAESGTEASASSDATLPNAREAREAREQVLKLLDPARNPGTSAETQGFRVDVQVGELDPRLRLAPCQRVETTLPPGARPWGRTRVSLRCVQGPVRWNVYLPVTVKVFGPALVVTRALPAGTALTAQDVRVQDVDLAEDASPALTRVDAIDGATSAVLLQPGQTLRQRDLRLRQWFVAGETVRIEARGDGFAVSQEGIALTPGLEGQVARIKTESGRVIAARPSGLRAVTVAVAP